MWQIQENLTMALNSLFLNQCFDKNRLKNLITWSLLRVGERQTIETVENLKSLGFQFATQAGVSLSVDDLKIPPEKLSLVSQASQQVEATQQAYHRGNLTAIEKLQQLVDTWHRASETLKQTVVNHFQSTDKLSPVYMMAFSGARGNISQVRQLAGMRGLMADPQGQIIGFPIRSNFREGLTLTEYMISCYGARKGLVDTALRTADAGYLTRRLVDVSQHMIVKAATCATPRGIVLKDLQSSTKVVLPLRERLIGRVLAEDVAEDVAGGKSLSGYSKPSHHQAISLGNGHQTNEALSGGSTARIGVSTQPRQAGLVAYRNQEISAKLAVRIASYRDAVLVRSPLTCAIRHGVCQLCYGWSLSESRLVTLGEAVGIIAAQSIGEPGTQLTMRTFHTGGVFSGDVMAEVRAPHDGVVDFPQPLQGLLVRTSHGKIAFLTKAPGSLLLGRDRSLATARKGTLFSLEPLTVVFVRQHERVARTQLIAEFSSMGREMNETVEAKRILFSEMVGQVSFANVALGTRLRQSRNILQVSRNLGFVWILSGRKSPVTPLLSIYSKGSHLVNQSSLVTRVASKPTWQSSILPIIPDSTGTQFRSKAAILHPGHALQERRSIHLGEGWGRRSDQDGGVVDTSPVTTTNARQAGSCGTFSTPLRFVPNLGYCAISSSYGEKNREPAAHFGIRGIRPALTWSRSGSHLKATTQLSGRQPKELLEGLQSHVGLATGEGTASNLTSSPDCLLFGSAPPVRSKARGGPRTPIWSALGSHQERCLLAAPLFQKPSPAPSMAGLHCFAMHGPRTPFASIPPLTRHGGHNEIVARPPDFYWLPGEQKSGQTGLAWVDSRYIGKRFAHGEIVWIDQQNLEWDAIHGSQVAQAQASSSRAGLAPQGQAGSVHLLRNVASFSKEDLVKAQGQHFARIDDEPGGKPNRIDTIAAELDRQRTIVPMGPIHNLGFVVATHGTNPLARKSAVGNQQRTRIEGESQFENQDFYKTNGNYASWRTKTMGADRLAAGTRPPRPEKPLGRRDTLKASRPPEEQNSQEPSLKSASSPGFGAFLNLLIKGRNQAEKEMQGRREAWSHAPHLRTNPGWAYFPYEQVNLLKSHESIQFCGESPLDNLFFEPVLVYLEAFKGGQFPYSTADTLPIANLRVQLLGLGLAGRNRGEGRTETGTSPTVASRDSLFQHLATQGLDIQRETEEGQPILGNRVWASHAPVSNLHRAGEQPFQGFREGTPMVWPLGEKMLLILRKMLWLAQPFATPLANLNGGESFLQALLQKRTGAEDAVPPNRPNPFADRYQILFIRNLLNREPFLWLRGLPVQIQVVTNKKARHVGMVSPLHNRFSHPIHNLTGLNSREGIQGVTIPESQPAPRKIDRNVVSSPERSKVKPYRGLCPLVQADFLFPYGFTLGLIGSYLPVSPPFRTLKEGPKERGGKGVRRPCIAKQCNPAHKGATFLHKRAAATWLQASRIVGAANPIRADWNRFQPTRGSTWQGSLEKGQEGGLSNSVRPQRGLICGPLLGRSWLFEPALATPSLLMLARQGHRYSFSMLEKSKALFLKRHTLTKISLIKRLPIPLGRDDSLAFSTKQWLTPLIVASPDIRFNVTGLVPFDGFQTAFLPRPLYLIRFAGSFSPSPSPCRNEARLQQGSSTEATIAMSGFRSLGTDEGVRRPPLAMVGVRRPPLHRKRCTRSKANEGVEAVVSPWAGEMVSERSSPPKHGREPEGHNKQDVGQQPKWQQATRQRGGNVLFTQADHASFAREGRNSKASVGEFVSIGDEVVSGYATPASGQIVAIERDKLTLRRTQALLFYAQGVMHVNHGEWVEKNAPILTLTYQKLITGDIVQGIPKIEQFFEAPATKEGEPLPNSLQARLRRSFQRLKQHHPVPQAAKRSLAEIQQILVEGILKVYFSQGVRIADKHLEIVIRQMTSKGQVLDAGNTGLFQGEEVRLDRIERINLATYGEKADYEPAVLGITQASLESESFISAASFQETTRVLSRDTIIGKTDFLRGLKERVVLGDLVQAGTGVDDNINYGLLFGIAPTSHSGEDPAIEAGQSRT